MENLQPGDNSSIIIGGITRMIEPRRRFNAGPPKVKLFKCLLSNFQGGNIVVLFWQECAVQFESSVFRQIIEIIRSGVVLANPAFADPELATVRVELSIQASTAINILGPIPEENIPAPIPIHDIILQNIDQAVRSTIRIVYQKKIKKLFEKNGPSTLFDVV